MCDILVSYYSSRQVSLKVELGTATYKKKKKKKLETQFVTSLSAEAVVAYPAAANVQNQVHVGGETLQLCDVSTRQKHGNPIACNVLFECSAIVCIYQSLFSIKY
jgi:hypothetical protein